MNRPALFTQQRKAALAIADEWSIPGLDADDVRQEALLALWNATAKHDPERGPWPAFARLSVKSWMTDLLRAASNQARTPPEGTVAEVEIPGGTDPADQALVNEKLARIRAAFAHLSPTQVEAIRIALANELQSRQVASAAYRARVTLRSALE